MGLFSLGKGIAKVGGVSLRHGVVLMDLDAPPTSGTTGTGAGFAGPGSVVFQTNGQQWVNHGTKANPTWVSAPSASASPSVSPSPSSSASASASPS